MLGCLLGNEIDDLFDISRMLLKIVLHFSLIFFCKLWRTSRSFFVIQSNKMMRFPRIKPIIDGNTVHGEYGHQCGGIDALRAQYNTMSTLPNTMVLALFIQSMQ